MGIISKLTAVFNGPYRYRAGPNTLGIGVENMALEQPGRAIDADFYSPRYNVRRSMETRFPAYQIGPQYLPENDLRANGLFLSGEFALQALLDAEQEAQGNG